MTGRVILSETVSTAAYERWNAVVIDIPAEAQAILTPK